MAQGNRLSVALGAVFGHFQALAEGDDGGSGYVHGAIAGALIAGTIVLLETFVLFGGPDTPLRRAPVLVNLSVRSLAYLAVTLIGLVVSAWLVPPAGGGGDLLQRDGLLFSLALVSVNRLLGSASSSTSPPAATAGRASRSTCCGSSTWNPQPPSPSGSARTAFSSF